MGETERASARVFFGMILFASIAAVAAAVLADWLWVIEDCTPCVYQRAPYVLAAAVAGFAILARPTPAGYRALAVVCALVFVAGCAVSALHEGVQQGWWALPNLCDELSVRPNANGATTAAWLDNRPLSACDAIEAPFLGIPLTMLNFVYSAVLAFVCAVTAAVGDIRAGAASGQ